MNFTTENIHRFHLFGAFTIDKPSKKHKGSTRKETVLRPVITARRREDLPEAMRRAIKWWGDKGMSALYLQVEWMPGVRSVNKVPVLHAALWRTPSVAGYRKAVEAALEKTQWNVPPYVWRVPKTYLREVGMRKLWWEPYTSIGHAMRKRPSENAVLMQGNRKVTQGEVDQARAAETLAWGVPHRYVPVREMGSPYAKRFTAVPEGAAPELREVVVDDAGAPEDGREAETTTWRAPGVTYEPEVVEDGAPPSPPGPPEYWHVLEHDHEAVQALALVAQANQWVVRRLPLEHGLDVMFACAPADVAAVRALLVKQDEEDDD